MTILDDIISEKKAYIQYLKESDYLKSLPAIKFDFYSFKAALASPLLSLIAEVKKASPSKGVINPNFDPVSLAKHYESLGASALSVLTDQRFFQGSNDYLTAIKQQAKLPVLRKDFIIDPIQIKEAHLIGADAILLIAAILTLNQAQELIDCAKNYKLDILFEVHNDDDLEKASLLRGIDILGVNNRNLKSFEVDAKTSLLLKNKWKTRFNHALWVAESGYDSVDQLKILSENDFSAVLIGEGLVKNVNMINYFNNEI
tara:strand:- start:229 stop:1002 length:774 start_codon:yes stop_codon:yes gene_type:complete